MFRFLTFVIIELKKRCSHIAGQSQRLYHKCTWCPWKVSGVFSGIRTHDLCDAGAVPSPTELWSHSDVNRSICWALIIDGWSSFLGFSVSRRRGWQLFFTKDTSFRKTTPNFALHFILLERRCNGPLVRYYIAPDSYLWGNCHNATFQPGGGRGICFAYWCSPPAARVEFGGSLLCSEWFQLWFCVFGWITGARQFKLIINCSNWNIITFDSHQFWKLLC